MQQREASRKPVWPIILVMLLVGTITAMTSILVVYQSALESEKERLVEQVGSYTRLIDAVARVDTQYNTENHRKRPVGTALSQIREFFTTKPGFGETGEFVIGQRAGDNIDFLLNSRRLDRKVPLIPITAGAAEPMRRALAGQSGKIIGLDYRSVNVLAAYKPIPHLNLGFVAKIDLSEFRAPFLKASLISGFVAVFVIALGILLLSQIETPSHRYATDGHPFNIRSTVQAREWFLYRVLLMTFVSMVLTGVSLWILYESSYETAKHRMVDIVEGQARFIDAVARSDEQYSTTAYSAESREATLSQIRKAFDTSQGFGKTGEFVIGSYDGYNIVFLTTPRHLDYPTPPVHMTADEAKPMQHALAGRSGNITGLDYRGEAVLAAYEPLSLLGAGLVAKIDVKELRTPFVKAAIIATAVAVIMIFLGSAFIWRLLKPVSPATPTDSLSAIASDQSIDAQRGITPGLLAFTTGLGLAILILDLSMPLGVAGSVLYVAFVLSGKWFPRRSSTIWLAIIATAFTVIGYLASPSGEDEWVVLTNRILALCVIWVTALMVSIIKASEHALNAQATELQKLSLSVEHSPVSVIITDADGKIQYVNLKFSEATGFNRDEVIGKNPRILQSGETSLNLYPELWKTIKAGKEWRGEFHNRKKTGEIYCASAAILPIISSNGEILHFVAIQEDITQRKEAEKQLEHLATHDNLTGLPTRKLSMDRLSSAIAVARRSKSKAAVLFIDLDGFKAVNDTLGHEAGDYVLSETATRLGFCVREIDTIARIGGDEFMIVLGSIHSVADVSIVAKKVIQVVGELYRLENATTKIGASIGIALYPDNGDDPEELVKKADLAMYETKRKGKNGYAFAQVSHLQQEQQ